MLNAVFKKDSYFYIFVFQRVFSHENLTNDVQLRYTPDVNIGLPVHAEFI